MRNNNKAGSTKHDRHRNNNKHMQNSVHVEQLDSATKAYRQTWHTALGLNNLKNHTSSQKQKAWSGTTRRNTVLGVDGGRGTGRILSSHYSTIQRNMDDNLEHQETPMHITHSIRSLEMSKKKAMQDFMRRKRTYLAARYEHQNTLQRNFGLNHVEGVKSIYGDHRFK